MPTIETVSKSGQKIIPEMASITLVVLQVNTVNIIEILYCQRFIIHTNCMHF